MSRGLDQDRKPEPYYDILYAGTVTFGGTRRKTSFFSSHFTGRPVNFFLLQIGSHVFEISIEE